MLQLVFLLFEAVWFGLFVFALLYSSRKQGYRQTIVFFLPAVIWGLLLEYATQEVFERYFYGDGFLVYVANVPLNISLAWAALMYFSYVLVTEKLHLKNSVAIALAASGPLLLVDALLLEPLAQIFGFWIWTPESVWFDSPIGNIFGWFWVIALYLSFYRFIHLRINSWKKALLLNLALIVLRVIILTLLLSVWDNVFGNL